MRVKLTDFANFFSTEIVALEQNINSITHGIQNVESKYKDLDLTKDISEYENTGNRIVENIRSIFNTYHSKVSDNDVKFLCNLLATQHHELKQNESCIALYHDYESKKKRIEDAKMRLDNYVKERQRVLKLREINEYLNAVPHELLEEFFQMMTK
jgi:hypothetical protein